MRREISTVLPQDVSPLDRDAVSFNVGGREMKTQAQPWAVHERTLTDGSKVYDVWYMRSDGVGVPEVTVHAHSESAAYICADELNAAIAKAE
jgi:hypothetical protein